MAINENAGGDYIFIIPIVVAIIAMILGFYYFNKTFKTTTETIAREKQKDEMQLAREVKEENRLLAKDVKEAMVNHVAIIVSTLKQDNELQKTILLSELNLMKQTESQIRTDLEANIKDQQIINERMQKGIDFMTQFLWGTGAKSVPPFLEGEDETHAHKLEPNVGIFTEPDSSETQEFKDSVEGGTTTSEEITESKKKSQEMEDESIERQTEKKKQEMNKKEENDE